MGDVELIIGGAGADRSPLADIRAGVQRRQTPLLGILRQNPDEILSGLDWECFARLNFRSLSCQCRGRQIQFNRFRVAPDQCPVRSKMPYTRMSKFLWVPPSTR
jgi:hypothetical protein